MKGRTIRTARRRKRFLESLESTGHVLRSTAAAGASIRAFYKWREDDLGFAAEWEAALECAIDRLEDEAFLRALQGVEVPVYYRGKPVGALSKYSDRLLIFLLTRLRANKFQEPAATTVEDNSVENMSDGEVDGDIDYLQAAEAEEAPADPAARAGAPARLAKD